MTNDQTPQDHAPRADEHNAGKTRMNRLASLTLFGAAVALPLGLLALGLSSSAQTSQKAQAAPRTADAPAATLPTSPKTNAVVEAANAFLATLSEQQRTVARIELSPQNAAR